MKRTMMLCVVVMALVCLRAAPVHAFGLGLFGNFDGGKFIWDGVGSNFMNYGGGFVMDTNLASNQLFNYRLELTFSNLHSSYQSVETDWPLMILTGFPIDKTVTRWEDSFLLSTVHYFGFGVVRTKHVRFWLGPQITFGGMLTNLTGLYAGIGFAMGLNINIGDVFTLSLTGSGRFLGAGRFYTYNGVYYTSGGYGGDGLVTLAFIFRIPGDKYR